MFAGPNGSGKTTVKRDMPPHWVGVYINPDEIEAGLRRDGCLPLQPYQVSATTAAIREFLTGSDQLRHAGLADACVAVTCDSDIVRLNGLTPTAYHAATLADFLRGALITAGVSFSFETVMSHPSKVDVLRAAQAAGFRSYLYYVATDDPAINVGRVRLRVAQGGHDVPAAKVVERYHRSLALVRDAIRHTDRAFLFDTSGPASRLIATVTAGRELELQSDTMPH